MKYVEKRRPIFEAWQWSDDNPEPRPVWFEKGLADGTIEQFPTGNPFAVGFEYETMPHLFIANRVHVVQGDWIVRGVGGEWMVMKPRVFADTYEEASE